MTNYDSNSKAKLHDSIGAPRQVRAKNDERHQRAKPRDLQIIPRSGGGVVIEIGDINGHICK